MTEEQLKILRGYDFMRLGQSINSGKWQTVAIITKSLAKKLSDVGITEFDRWLTGIRQCANGRNKAEALQLMTLVTNRRVQLINGELAKTSNK